MSVVLPQTTSATLPVLVVGAGGLLAGELLRLVCEHPGLALAGAVTRAGGEQLASLHPQLGAAESTVSFAEVVPTLAAALAAGERPVLFLALPHGESARAWRTVRAELGETAERVLVVDLSADYRLDDPEAYRRWYGEHADPSGPESFVYGLPELVGERLAGATRIAAPGCFATALQLATWPAAQAGLLQPSAPWIYVAVTGSSGSGVKPRATTHHPHRHGNLWAYAVDGHRHEAELMGSLAPLGLAPEVVFLPHSGPFVRGIHLTATLPLAVPVAADEARACFAETYAGKPFVEVLDRGQPDLRRVVGSNRAALGVSVRGSMLVVTCTLDNVIKGGAGQALQALNLALDWPETAGLPRAALGAL